MAVFYGAAAWLILQVGDVVLELICAPDGSLRLVATILALGFPFAMILAWAFEITPEGIKRDREVDRSDDKLSRAGRKLDVATIALLLIAIGLFAWVNFRATEAPAPIVAERAAPAPAAAPAFDGPRDLSIAVLPFVNMSTDPENEYFSEGLSEELLNVLARIEDFRVAGRTSSFAFKGQNQDLRAIGERLSVANILEGSVRKQGNRIRVTAQLIDARSGYHLWSDTYERRLDDVFAIQDEIATEVVKALRLTLLAADEVVIAQTAKGDVEACSTTTRIAASPRPSSSPTARWTARWPSTRRATRPGPCAACCSARVRARCSAAPRHAGRWSALSKSIPTMPSRTYGS